MMALGLRIRGDGALQKGVKGGFPAAVRSIIIVGEECQSEMLNGKRCASNDTVVSAST
jgi:hypothetical protein